MTPIMMGAVETPKSAPGGGERAAAPPARPQYLRASACHTSRARTPPPPSAKSAAAGSAGHRGGDSSAGPPGRLALSSASRPRGGTGSWARGPPRPGSRQRGPPPQRAVSAAREDLAEEDEDEDEREGVGCGLRGGRLRLLQSTPNMAVPVIWRFLVGACRCCG
jgi:hypothetical protein